MDVEEFEANLGWRGVFNGLPATRNAAQKAIMPLGFFYSPFLANPQPFKASPLLCAKCQASIHSFTARNKATKTWNCSFCLTANPLSLDLGLQQVEQYVENKVGENGIYFMVDLCLSKGELNAVKEILLQTIANLPRNIYVGLLAFNRNVLIYDFEDQFVKFTCLRGTEDYSSNDFKKLREALNLQGTVDPKFHSKVVLNRYYVPLQNHEQKLVQAVKSLRADSHVQYRQLRQKRATGCAMQVGIGLLSTLGINTRFSMILGGPCTVGMGKVVELPHKYRIRSFGDILEGAENTEHMKSATAFYQGLEGNVVKNRHTVDVWAYGLDQFGLMEMRSIVNGSGGLLAMHELFDHFIFRSSYPKFYEANEDGLFNFPIGTQLSLKVSKSIRINGILGTCKSLKDNALKTASEMEIGQGGTNTWYVGGIGAGNSLCIIVSLFDNTYDPRDRSVDLQAVTTYKWSDNIIRTRVSTYRLEVFRENQIIELGKRFDEQAAAVMLARMAAVKTEIEDPIEVKKWVDRILLKFSVRFGHFNRHDRSGFRLPHSMRHFPQFIYHLRRSGFVNPFGAPPDQSIYVKTCMLRESIANCMVMVQPALLRYTAEQTEPVPVELDLDQLQDEVVLLMDSFFMVLVWQGPNVYDWKQQGLDEDPEYDYLKPLFETPIADASQIMYDRIPVSNFYQTHKNDPKGKERYLKSRVNPSKKTQVQEDGHFVSDDAPITLFMDYLVKSVINYNE